MKDVPKGDLHLVFFGEFTRWLKKTKTRGIKGVQTPSELWAVIPNQQSFFICLIAAAFYPHDSELCHWFLCACYRVAPDLTCLALPMIRRAVTDYNLKDRDSWEKPALNRGRGGVKAKQAEADLRRRIRNAEVEFMRLKGG